MSAYKGASNANVLGMLQNLPHSIAECYKQFWSYFSTYKAFANLEFVDILLGLLAVGYLAIIMVHTVKLWKQKKLYACVFLGVLALLPVASCVVLLLAVGSSMSTIMSIGMLVCVIVLGSLFFEEDTPFLLKRVGCVILMAFVWYQLAAVTNDQIALKEGKTATITLTENILSELIDEGYLEEGNIPVAFVGRPAENQLFEQSAAYQMANAYAHFGCWSTDPQNNRYSWSGVLNNYVGVSLNLCPDETYQTLRSSEEVENMPVFPKDGSIRKVDGVVVVKVSDLY